MKALNIGTESIDENQSIVEKDFYSRQPCWYANFDFDGDDREEAQWKVGLKDEQESHEHSFKLSKAGDVENETFWAFATSANFAIKLISLYRLGNQKSVNEWVKKGCPI